MERDNRKLQRDKRNTIITMLEFFLNYTLLF